MKRFSTFILLYIILFTPVHVFAKDNILSFEDYGSNRLRYKSSLFNEDIFIHHTDMIPGSSYVDRLIIENKTKTDYKLYLRVVEKEQSKLANELLENIEMMIYLNGKLLYEGYAKGLDYNGEGINLQNAIYIGEYKADNVSILEVKTKLIPEYSNTENNELSYIDWEFIANYEEDLIVINPDTGDNILIFLRISLTILITISVSLIIINKKINNQKIFSY